MRNLPLAIFFAISLVFPSLSAQEKAGTTLLKALGAGFIVKKKEPVAVQMPRNSVDSPSDAITPTGGRLKPFGNPQYWGPEEPAPIDAELGLLPPLPDLRTPDQMSKAELQRARRLAALAEQQARNEAREAEIRALQQANRPQPKPDPSSALIQVESQKRGAVDHGRRDRPDSVNGGQLKPFNAGSTFIEEGEVKFQWTNREFVEPQPDPGEEELLGLLPPLPDLRTPDQISGAERKRSFLQRRAESRRLRDEEKRRELEQFAREAAEARAELYGYPQQKMEKGYHP